MTLPRWIAVAATIAALPASGAPRVTLKVEATTWRENRKPFDVRTAVTQKLTAAGVAVVKTGGVAELEITWDESEGDSFREIGREDGPTRTGTDLSFDLVMWVGSDAALSLSATGGPGEFVHGDLYGTALAALQKNDAYAFAGHLVAASLGQKSSLPKLLPMLCGEGHDIAAGVFAKAGYQPASPAEEAYFAQSKDDLDRLIAIGKPAVPAILDCKRRTEPPYYELDEDVVNVLAAIGDPRATPWLLGKLEQNDFLQMMNSPEMEYEDSDVPDDLLTLLAGLGDTGDGRALAKLDSLALKKKKFPTLASASKDAAAKIRIRAKGGVTPRVSAASRVCTDAGLGVELTLPPGWAFVASPEKVCAFSDGAKASGEITVTEGGTLLARAEQVQASLGAKAVRSANVVSGSRVVQSYTVGDLKLGLAFVPVDRGIATVLVADRGTRSLPELERVAKGLSRIPVTARANVIPLDVDPGRVVLAGKRLFVVAGSDLVVVDTVEKRVVKRVSAGGAIADVKLDPAGAILWCAVASRGLRAFDLAALTFGEDVSIGGGDPGEIAVGRVAGKGTRVFVMRFPPHRVQEIDASSRTRVGEIEALGFHIAPVLSPDGSRLYVTTQGGIECGGGRDPIGIFDPATGARTGMLGRNQGCPAQVGSCAALTGDGRFLVSNGADAGKYGGFPGGVIHAWDVKSETLAGTLKPGVALGCPQTAPGLGDRFFASIEAGDSQELGAWTLPGLAKSGWWKAPDGGSFTGFVAFAPDATAASWTAWATYTAKAGGSSRGIAILRSGP